MSARPNNVSSINPSLSSLTCPSALKDLQGWLCWRYESVAAEVKPRKVPYYVNGGRRHGIQGRPEDRAKLTTFEAARAAAARRGMDGVGLALLADFNLVALDFDRCVGPDGIDPEVERLIDSTYSEFSPSGQGVRAFMRGHLGNAKDQGGRFGFEVFSSSGFVTFTGNTTPSTDVFGLEETIEDVTPAVAALCHARFAQQDVDDPLMTYEPAVGLTGQQIQDCLDVLDADSPHEVWLRVGMALHHETSGQGFDLWDTWSAAGAKYPGREALRSRWESFGRATGKLATARSLIRLATQHGAYVNTNLATASDFEVISASAPGSLTESGQAAPNRFPVIEPGAFTAQAPQSWLIKNVLPRADLIVMFGASGSGKSFMALDLAVHITQGKSWRNYKTKRGRVVYIAAEGAGGFRKRLQAYAKHHMIDFDDLKDLGIVHAAPNLLEKSDSVDLARSIKGWGPTDLIIVDTLSQVIPGANENSGEDIGRALAHCNRIKEATGATVLLIHHAGKDSSKGARGWSGLRAAADAELEVVRTDQCRTMQLTKSKDSEDNTLWAFDLEVVPVGVDDDGDVIDSCVVVPAELPAKEEDQPRKLGQVERLVVETYQELADASGSVPLDRLIDEVVRRRPAPPEGQRDQRRSNSKRTIFSLAEGQDAPFWINQGMVEGL